MERIKTGEQAPDFTLKDQNGKDFKLAELKGKKVLLSFHPLAWTGVCATQMQSLETNRDKFKELNTIAIGLSIDSSPSKMGSILPPSIPSGISESSPQISRSVGSTSMCPTVVGIFAPALKTSG